MVEDDDPDNKALIELYIEREIELETRLEQAINGWTIEKENNKQLQEKHKKLNALCATLDGKLNKANDEIHTITIRLEKYADLPYAVCHPP